MKKELLSRLDCSLAVEIQLSLGVENTLYLHIVGSLIRNDLSCPLSVFLSVVLSNGSASVNAYQIEGTVIGMYLITGYLVTFL